MSLSEFKGDLIFPGPAGATKEDPSDSGEALLLLQAAVLPSYQLTLHWGQEELHCSFLHLKCQP